MTKKKGFFSKFKKSKPEEYEEDEIISDIDERDEEEFIEVDETGEEIEDEPSLSKKPGLFSKIKSKFSKGHNDNDEDNDEADYEDDDLEDSLEEDQEEFEDSGQRQLEATKTGIFSKIKSKLGSSDELEEDFDDLDEEMLSEEQPSHDQTNTEIKVNLPEDLTGVEQSLEDDSIESSEEQSPTAEIKVNSDSFQENQESEELHDEAIETSIEEDHDINDQLNDNLEDEFNDDLEEELDDEDFDNIEPPKKSLKLPGVDTLVSKFKNRENSKSRFSLPFKKSQSESSFKGSSSKSHEQLILSILGKKGRGTTHRIFIYALTLTLFYNVGKFTGLFLGKEKPLTPQSNFSRPKTYSPRKDIASIERNNIFNAIESEEEKIKKPEPKKKLEPEIKVCLSAENKSSLSVKLLHTVVLQDTVKSVASVSKRGKIINIREGEKIDNLAEIGRIEDKKIIFKNLSSKKCEFIEAEGHEKRLKFPEPKIYSADKAKDIKKSFKNDAIQVEGNKYQIKKKLRDELLSNVGEILTQARAVPIKNPDGTLSFKMTEVVPGSIFSQLNIKNDDIVTGLNGRKIKNMNELMAMFGKIKQTNNYEITIKRDGAEQTLNYNFTD